jgi:hypothetical protein
MARIRLRLGLRALAGGEGECGGHYGGKTKFFHHLEHPNAPQARKDA